MVEGQAGREERNAPPQATSDNASGSDASASTAGAPTLTCWQCGQPNDVSRDACSRCAARLRPRPSSPAGLAAGDRRPQVWLAVVVAVVVVGAWLVILSDGEPETQDQTPAEPAATASTGDGSDAVPIPTLLPVPVDRLFPVDIVASSESDDFHASHLIDDDNALYWTDAGGQGVGVTLTFTFASPVVITSIELQNLIDEEAFRSRHRIRNLEVSTGDRLPRNLSVADSNVAQVFEMDPTAATTVVLRVLGTYPGEDRDGHPAHQELALAEVRFFGRDPGSVEPDA